ncbi:MAG: hypothetical protein K9G70_07655 [Prolixibacteraceae bacterium]|nr:hypothetical protein [Prolixibacteraceae bacterium]
MLVDLLARTDFMEKAGTGIKRVYPVRYKYNVALVSS